MEELLSLLPPYLIRSSIHKNIKLPIGEEIRLLFYDTARQEQYRAVSYNLSKGADGLFLMYDIGNKKTFNDINEWLRNIREIKGDNFPIILIGNKCDLKEEEKVITKEEGEKLANDNGFAFFETSCKKGINIEESVQFLVYKIIDRMKREKKQLEYRLNQQVINIMNSKIPNIGASPVLINLHFLYFLLGIILYLIN